MNTIRYRYNRIDEMFYKVLIIFVILLFIISMLSGNYIKNTESYIDKLNIPAKLAAREDNLELPDRQSAKEIVAKIKAR